MIPVELQVFTGRDLQNTEQLLLLLERSGIDVRMARQQVESWRHRKRQEMRISKKNGLPKQSQHVRKPEPKETIIKQSNIPCPECHKGYLQVKKLDGVTYTACPQCYKSVEFK